MRIHTLFADGVDNMHITWEFEKLLTLLRLYVFLFFGGLVIYLFNVDHKIFVGMDSWIGVFTLVLALLPLIRHDSPYRTPLLLPAWFLYSSIQDVASIVLSFITDTYSSYETWSYNSDLRDRCRGWISGSEWSSEIDVRILGGTASALGDDDALEKFFEAIPGLFNSRLVEDLERDFPLSFLETFWHALGGFMGRTLSSNSVTELDKSRRDVICREIISMVPCPGYHMDDNLRSHYYQAPVSIERLQAMAR